MTRIAEENVRFWRTQIIGCTLFNRGEASSGTESTNTGFTSSSTEVKYSITPGTVIVYEEASTITVNYYQLISQTYHVTSYSVVPCVMFHATYSSQILRVEILLRHFRCH